MGNTQTNIVDKPVNISSFDNKYNWILSYPLKEYDKIDSSNIEKYCPLNIKKKYIDLRVNCPPILNIENIPVHPIASICSLLNYQLNKNKLPTFPPSRLYIYHNCNFFLNIKSLLSFEIIFKAIEQYGFCSELDYSFNEENLSIKPNNNHYNVGEAFKFIDVKRIPNQLEIIQQFLKNDIPLLIGIVLYNDLNKVVYRLNVPDLTLDKRIGGTSGLIVGYSDDNNTFFVKFAYGKSFGSSGYLSIPYEYILNTDLVPEIYSVDLIKHRIEGFLNQKKKTINLEKKRIMNNNNVKYDDVQSFFT